MIAMQPTEHGERIGYVLAEANKRFLRIEDLYAQQLLREPNRRPALHEISNVRRATLRKLVNLCCHSIPGHHNRIRRAGNPVELATQALGLLFRGRDPLYKLLALAQLRLRRVVVLDPSIGRAQALGRTGRLL